jgi:DNA-binding NarL/FixJ family response regulator
VPDEIRVLIADDQPLVRQGLRGMLAELDGVRLVGEASNGWEAVQQTRRMRPDVVLMDVNMPRMNGIEATRELVGANGSGTVRVIILTMYDHDENLFQALRAGASGFVLKDLSNEKLAEAIHEVARGEALLSPTVTRRLVDEFARRPALSAATKPAALTGREFDVLTLLVRGHSNADIARMLVLGESTVKSHVQHLYDKLGVRDRVQVVIYAYENGLVDRGVPPAVGDRRR